MLKSILDYFYFSQKEKRGIFALLSIILILIFSTIFVTPQIGKKEPANQQTLIAWVDSLIQKPDVKAETKVVDYFKFDPNLIIKEDWLKLGLSEKQAQTILNYRNAGGKFFKKEDLKKIYSINDAQYQKLEPHIFIQKTKSVKPKKKPQTKNLSIDLNSTDSIELIKIRGIGSVFSSRILKYRSLLGGYTHPEQLMEVYGIDSAKFQKMKRNFTTCDSSKIFQLNINTANFKQLLKHPYINYEFVKYIVNARKEEQFNSVDDLSTQTILSNLEFRKLRPYLKVK